MMKRGDRVQAHNPPRTGTVVWIGKSRKTGRRRIGVKPDGQDHVQYWTPGLSIHGQWAPITQADETPS